ncbi:sulfite exporter TauE/SafE family protein [Chelatococcus sp. SYSU_G07232]|uniref:Probable membrane transporter protein n=1 Tax=Chelatococcus albus TaxID=3047466 RepID=A0ABT7AHI0_9HYPH|nr:sulfite exporter TauE/SafE family protein [Chelatococcus sp. SYSU_G07232]MDJ1158274.1 sulfite exporter TauE/SafE family protein [Chelatococcus sp. SYSU_G07232]
MIADPFFYLAAVPAVVIVGLAKGGFVGLGILGIPLIALVVPPMQAAAIMLPILMVQDVVSIWAYRRHVDRRTLAVMLPGALAGIVLGAATAAIVSDAHVRLIVGIVALAFAANWWFGLSRQVAAHRPGGVASGLFWGGVSSFTSFVSHAGGPPFQVHVLPLNLTRDTLVGTTAWFFAIVNLVKVAPYFWLGQFTCGNLLTAAVLFPAAVASTLAGVWVVRRIDGRRFYRIIYGLLALVGIKLVADGIGALLP